MHEGGTMQSKGPEVGLRYLWVFGFCSTRPCSGTYAGCVLFGMGGGVLDGCNRCLGGGASHKGKLSKAHTHTRHQAK